MIIVNKITNEANPCLSYEVLDDRIKVIPPGDGSCGFYYIDEPHNYAFYDQIEVPDVSKRWQYIDGQFIQIIENLGWIRV